MAFVIGSDTGVNDGLLFTDDGTQISVATAGSDSIVGSDNPDTINGLGGDDTIDALGGNDIVDGGTGNDSINGGAGNDSINGNDGRDILLGGKGEDTLIGGNEDDSLNGNLGNDSISGDGGNDTIVVDVVPGVGNDIVDGGIGTDVLVINGDNFGADVPPNDLFFFTAPGVISQVNNTTNTAFDLTFQNIERIVFNGNGGSDLLGASANGQPLNAIPVSLVGGAGNDTLVGGTGNDSLQGNEGNDSVLGGPGSDIIIENPLQGTADVLDFSNLLAPVTLNFAAGTATSGADVDTIQGTANFETFVGTAANDTFNFVGFPAGGLATINGGEGVDTVIISDPLLVDGNPANGELTLINVEVVQAGGAGDDSLNGTPGNDFLDGFAGRDTINGLAGADTLVGGLGDDSITGGPGNDSITGNEGNDTFVIGLGDGNDFIDGGTGTDTLIANGGKGLDILTFDAVTNSFARRNGGDPDNFSATLNDVEVIVVNGDAGTDVINLQGYGGNSTISGGKDNDSLIGSNQDDTVQGDAGDDTLVATGGADFFVENIGQGADTVDFSQRVAGVTVQLPATPSGTGSVTGGATISLVGQFENFIGTDAADVFTDGENYSNVLLDGGKGNDQFFIFGNSTLTGNDTIIGGEGIDTLFLVNSLLVDGDPLNGELTINGIEVIQFVELAATPGDDVITGTTGNDTIDGLDGADTIVGGTGNDALFGSAGNDQLGDAANEFGQDFISGGPGNDILNGGNDNDILNGGADDDILSGDQGNDSLAGGEGDDILNGGAGSDTLEGGKGVDRLIGDDASSLLPVADTLTGGDDADVFVLGSTTVPLNEVPFDTITDFNPFLQPQGDNIELVGFLAGQPNPIIGLVAGESITNAAVTSDIDAFVNTVAANAPLFEVGQNAVVGQPGVPVFIFDQGEGELFVDLDGTSLGVGLQQLALLQPIIPVADLDTIQEVAVFFGQFTFQ